MPLLTEAESVITYRRRYRSQAQPTRAGAPGRSGHIARLGIGVRARADWVDIDRRMTNWWTTVMSPPHGVATTPTCRHSKAWSSPTNEHSLRVTVDVLPVGGLD